MLWNFCMSLRVWCLKKLQITCHKPIDAKGCECWPKNSSVYIFGLKLNYYNCKIVYTRGVLTFAVGVEVPEVTINSMNQKLVFMTSMLNENKSCELYLSPKLWLSYEIVFHSNWKFQIYLFEGQIYFDCSDSFEWRPTSRHNVFY